MITSFLLAAPWLALLGFLLFGVRLPRGLPRGRPTRAPRVSVVVPARNEAKNIEACLLSLLASDYPDFDIAVVDDQSEDGTAELVRRLAENAGRSVEVVGGRELPEGWLGKPWACWQGALRARGELILFTDADTVHEPDLLSRAVRAREEDDADLLSLIGRQLMQTFWERLVQPQVFLTMLFRFHHVERAIRKRRWRSVIANGQFMLFTRDAYMELGGHQAVKGEVVEDLALAQRVVRQGRRLSVRMADRTLATRMYRSLGELVEGWSKNILLGGLQTMPPALRPMVAPTSTLVGATLWLAPPVTLVSSLLGLGGGGLLLWSMTAVVLSLALWTIFTVRMGAPFAYGLLYPLGAAVGMYIFLRSWTQGRNVRWKGRAYVLEDPFESRKVEWP